MRRFVIAAGPADAAQEKAIQNILADLGGWWHWIPNFWLLIVDEDDGDEISARLIRDQVVKVGVLRTVVFEFDEDRDWATSGAPVNGKTMWGWIQTTWAGEEDDTKPSS